MKNSTSSLKLILRDLRFVNSIYPGTIWLLVLEGMLEGCTPFISIYTSAVIINGVERRLSLRVLLTYAFLSVSLTLLVSGIKALITQFKNVRWQEMRYKLDLKISLKMSQVDYSRLENHDTYQLFRSLDEMENLGSGLNRIGNVFQPAVKGLSAMILSAAVVYQVFTITGTDGGGLIEIICAPWSAMIVAACMVGSVLINVWTSKGVFHATRTYLDKSRVFTNRMLYYTENYVKDYAAGKDIRLYGQKKLIHQDLANLVLQKNRDNERCENQIIAYQGIGIFASGLLNLIAYLYVALKSLAGLFSVGNIVRYVGSIMQFTSGLESFLNGYAQLKANSQFMDAYFRFFKLPSALHTGNDPIPSHQPLQIEFRDVSFSYPGTNIDVLKHFSCKLEPGKHYAVVGLNGSGKTTVVKLLCRLYDPNEGRILLGGKDIREYDYGQYLSLFSVVFQDFRLFPFSLGQNVSAEETYDSERVKTALGKAGFGSRFAALPAGCETVLSKSFDVNGIEMSGGEAQKIALARAIYKDAPLVVLDEPTAALDPVSEQEVYLKFHEISAAKTAIYISHRLSSCKFCDEILVIHHGRLVQQGCHEHLLEQQDGRYYEMWQTQAQHYSEM